MSSIFRNVSFGEFVRLILCLSLDICQYAVIFLLSSMVGDFYSFISLATTLYMFGWIGLLTLSDFVQGLDLLIMATVTWQSRVS